MFEISYHHLTIYPSIHLFIYLSSSIHYRSSLYFKQAHKSKFWKDIYLINILLTPISLYLSMRKQHSVIFKFHWRFINYIKGRKKISRTIPTWNRKKKLGKNIKSISVWTELIKLWNKRKIFLAFNICLAL